MTPKKISAIFVISFSLFMITLAPTTTVFLANISYAQLPESSTPPQPSTAATLPDGVYSIDKGSAAVYTIYLNGLLTSIAG